MSGGLLSSNTKEQENETSACSLDRARRGGAGLRPNANPTSNANHRSGRDNNRKPKGWSCFERIRAERWWSAKRREASHAKRRNGAHTSTSPLNLGPPPRYGGGFYYSSDRFGLGRNRGASTLIGNLVGSGVLFSWSRMLHCEPLSEAYHLKADDGAQWLQDFEHQFLSNPGNFIGDTDHELADWIRR
jgi:hypothetical protein